ncbi:SdpI family protein [Halarchaeum sp. P4]|uniref:SdpI family protein n=1 Tax=Halarchaeum sp. P4 TaxID=3421639 RepID=UPI003EB98393
MNSRQRLSLAAGFVVLSAVASILAAPALPEQLVTHWNAAGEPDATMSKPLALALFPALTAGLVALLVFVPRLDPLGENIEEFRRYYEWFIVIFTAFMFVLHAGIIAFNLGYAFDFTLLVLAAVAVLLYYLGVLLTHAEQNWFVGIRTPWTLSDEEVWTRTHELGGKLLKVTAVIALLGLFFGEYAVYFLLVPVLLTALTTVVYSYYLYQQREEASGTPPNAGHE